MCQSNVNEGKNGWICGFNTLFSVCGVAVAHPQLQLLPGWSPAGEPGLAPAPLHVQCQWAECFLRQSARAGEGMKRTALVWCALVAVTRWSLWQPGSSLCGSPEELPLHWVFTIPDARGAVWHRVLLPEPWAAVRGWAVSAAWTPHGISFSLFINKTRSNTLKV